MSEASYVITGENQLASLLVKYVQPNRQNQSRSFNYDDIASDYSTSQVATTDLGKGKVRGLKWRWICSNDTSTFTTTSEKVFSSYIQLTWDHEAMKGATGFHGSVKFTLTGKESTELVKNVTFRVPYSGGWVGERCLKVLDHHELKNSNQNRNQNIYYQNQNQNDYKLSFKLTCIPSYPSPDESKLLEKFARSDATDAAISIDGIMIHVNKSFLCFHSKYFEKLFNSQVEKQTSSVKELKEVALDDFLHLLSLIYPVPIEPTVEKVERYLELADMYLLPAATHQCEKFLETSPRVKNIQKIVLADKYGLEKLLKSTLLSITSKEDLKSLTRLPEYSKLGNDTLAAFMERFMHFLY